MNSKGQINTNSEKPFTSSSETSLDTQESESPSLMLTLGRDPFFASLSEPPAKFPVTEQKLPEIQIERRIGQGTYGTVFRAIQRQNGKFIAVKVIEIDKKEASFQSRLDLLDKEISILKRFEHSNIVKYLGSEVNLAVDSRKGEVRIHMEYMAGGSLSGIVSQYGALTETLIRNFARQICKGLRYLHSHGVVHRDLKGANILADGDGNLKLADFGASKHIQGLPIISENSEPCKSIHGSLYWMAPEIMKRERYGRKVDIWSFGCVILEMATGTHPWPNIRTYEELCASIANMSKPFIPETLSETCRDLIEKCLEYDKKKRLNSTSVLQHPFLTNN